ncbi:MAG: hypothetical protein AB1544_00265 [Pseudomonadota bacterium]
MVKACSRPRTAHALAAKAEVVRKSLAVRRAGSIPASGTNSGPSLFAQGRLLHFRQTKSMDNIRAAAWFHGTNSSQFRSWMVPPPHVLGEELRVPHSGIFFTRDVDAAQKVGSNVCSVKLTDQAKILDATVGSADAEHLRQLVMRNDLAKMCIYARTAQAWTTAWRSGEVLRFASDDPRFMLHLVRNAAQYKGIAPEVQLEIAQHNLTRGWIEHIVRSAAQLGFNALHGFEIDRHSSHTPRVVSWLAVTDAKAVTAPSWQ